MGCDPYEIERSSIMSSGSAPDRHAKTVTYRDATSGIRSEDVHLRHSYSNVDDRLVSRADIVCDAEQAIGDEDSSMEIADDIPKTND